MVSLLQEEMITLLVFTAEFLLTLCRRVGHLIKYPLVPGHLNTLNVQLHNVLLLTF